jgi:hypothetical protein
MKDAIELLRRDNDEVRRLLAELETCLAGAGPAGAGEVQRLAGRIAGAADRIRDMLARRV